jgi:hypothetical protein
MGTIELSNHDIDRMASLVPHDDDRGFFDRAMSDPHSAPYPTDIFYRACLAAKRSRIVNLPITWGDLLDLLEGEISKGGLKRITEAAEEMAEPKETG